jgi:ribosomal protein S18 acetylase RimI-like enzyme
MSRVHIRACSNIVLVSEPWKTLGETIDFQTGISRKQAFVCITKDGPVGFVIFTPDPVFARGGYLRAIGVLPAARRQGIGKKLLSFAEMLTARRSQYIFLCVSSFNRQGQSFYKNMGYRKAGTLRGLISPASSEYIYWKKLNSD